MHTVNSLLVPSQLSRSGGAGRNVGLIPRETKSTKNSKRLLTPNVHRHDDEDGQGEIMREAQKSQSSGTWLAI